MDSLERLGHSVEQAITLLSSLRRENRELAKLSASAAAAQEELGRLRARLAEAEEELTALRQEVALDPSAEARAQQAELEAARLAESLEAEQRRHAEERMRLESRIRELEMRLLEAEAQETMPVPQEAGQPAALARRCAELEVMLAETQAELEKSKGAVTALQVKIAATVSEEEWAAARRRIGELEAELQNLRPLEAQRMELEREKEALRRERRQWAAYQRERESMKARLDEIYALLDGLRLDG